MCIADDSGDVIEFDTFEGDNVIQKHSFNIPSAMLLSIEDELHAFGSQSHENKTNAKDVLKYGIECQIEDIKSFDPS